MAVQNPTNPTNTQLGPLGRGHAVKMVAAASMAKTMKKPALVKAARAAGWFALAATVVVCVFILYASRTGEGVPMALWFAFCFAVGGLPGLLIGRREKRENGA